MCVVLLGILLKFYAPTNLTYRTQYTIHSVCQSIDLNFIQTPKFGALFQLIKFDGPFSLKTPPKQSVSHFIIYLLIVFPKAIEDYGLHSS